MEEQYEKKNFWLFYPPSLWLESEAWLSVSQRCTLEYGHGYPGYSSTGA
jgi:hypothetical protein